MLRPRGRLRLRLRLRYGRYLCLPLSTQLTTSAYHVPMLLRRYGTTVTQHTFDSLSPPGGSAPLEPLTAAEGGVAATSKRTSMYEGIKETIAANPDSVVLTQVGSFYELYYDQAAKYGPRMNLKIAKKSTAEETCGYVHMSGFPCYQLDRYLKILVSDLETNVTIVDQFELPEPQNGRLFERKVTRTVTPGTLITESFIDSQHTNFLVSIVFTNNQLDRPANDESPVAIAWLDLSLGEFCFQSSTVKDLPSDIARLNPREILLDSAIKRYRLEEGEWHPDLAELKRYYISYHRFPGKEAFSMLSPFENMKVEQYHADNTDGRQLTATTAILAYVRENLPECEVQIKPPREQLSQELMRIDARSIEALELFNSSAADSARGSLFSTIRRTISPSGTRLLSTWLSAPLMNVKAIEQRQDWVQFFKYHGALSRDLVELFRYYDDVVRIIQRLSSMRRTDPADLVAVGSCVRLMQNILEALKKEKNSVIQPLIDTLTENLKAPKRFAKKVEKCIDADAVITRNENEMTEEEIMASVASKRKSKKQFDGMDDTRIMKEDATPALARLYDEYRNFDKHKQELWDELAQQQPSGIQINFKWSPMYSYHVHAAVMQKKNLSFEDICVPGSILNQTKSRQCIQYHPWTELGTRREGMNERKRKLEDQLLKMLRATALDCVSDIRACCDVVDTLDVVVSLATLAKEANLVRPQLNNEARTSIKKGRHITVETGLKLRGSDFTSNDCDLGKKLWVITGPNMGGKSTFIRQTALMSILAQIGSFVPATEATLGIVDQIFCRVGAADDLYRDRSTFMVEMLETSTILRNATSKSLAILDEVGRGTSSSDGLAIAYATIAHLTEVNKCRALFATHFGPELSDLLEAQGKTPHVEYHHATWHNNSFHYKLQPGVCDNSHGLHVAEIAGFPPRALELAASVHSNTKTWL